MPNTAQKYYGSPLRERLSTAARMTSQQRAERAQASSKRESEKGERKRSTREKKRGKDSAAPEKRKVARDLSGTRRVAIVVAVLLVVAIAILYPMGRTYYQTMREEQRLQAQLDAVNARNEAVSAENDALQTQEGIENQAREDLGWVKEGEQGAVVTNEQSATDNTSKLPERVDEKSIRAPQTWYYSILDTIFFVQT